MYIYTLKCLCCFFYASFSIRNIKDNILLILIFVNVQIPVNLIPRNAADIDDCQLIYLKFLCILLVLNTEIKIPSNWKMSVTYTVITTKIYLSTQCLVDFVMSCISHTAFYFNELVLILCTVKSH